MEKYGLTGKLVNKGEIIGYFLVDSNGKQMLITKDKTLELAKQNFIQNWEVVTDEDGENHLYSKDLSLVDIPTMLKDEAEGIEIKTRVLKDEKEVGFICVDNTGTKRNYTINKLWDLAKLGRLKDIKAYKSETSRVLLSANNRLRRLPEIRMD